MKKKRIGRDTAKVKTVKGKNTVSLTNWGQVVYSYF